MSDATDEERLRDALGGSPPQRYASPAALGQMAQDAAKDLAHLCALTGRGSLDFEHPRTGVRIRVTRARAERPAARAPEPLREAILLCPLPKSASLYLHDTLARTLDFDRVTICDHRFPSHVVPRLAPRLRFAGAVCHSHLAPSPRNLVLLGYWLTRMVVHVRDPRQVAVSALHHARRVQSEQGSFATLVGGSPLPDRFFEWDEPAQLDHVIERVMPDMVEWLNGWLDAADNPDFRPRIRFSRFEDFQHDNERFVRDLVEWYGIDWARCRFRPRPPREGQLHFRKGAREEWREVLSPDQQRRLNALIGARLSERFGWPRE